MTSSSFPLSRLRRLRQSASLRDMVQETRLSASDLIWPVFVIDGVNRKEPVSSMPDVDRLTTDLVVDAARKASDLGIPALALFPKTDRILHALHAQLHQGLAA